MSINIWTDSMQHAALLGKPVLFTNWLIQRDIIPDGWYCYDLRGTHKSPSTRTTLVDHAADYHAGTVLSPIPLKHEGTASRRVNGTFYLLGEEMTLEQFCEEHDLAYPQDNREFVLRPASLDEVGLFYSEEKLDEALGTVGHLRMDFGHGEKEFWHTWWPHNEDRFNTPEFKEVLQRFVDDLRQTGLLKNLGAMDAYCWQHGGSITEDRRSYGYIAETENYRFCLRCTPFPGEYQGYLYCYDLCQQEMYRQEHPVVDFLNKVHKSLDSQEYSLSYSPAKSKNYMLYCNGNFIGGLFDEELCFVYADSVSELLGQPEPVYCGYSSTAQHRMLVIPEEHWEKALKLLYAEKFDWSRLVYDITYTSIGAAVVEDFYDENVVFLRFCFEKELLKKNPLDRQGRILRMVYLNQDLTNIGKNLFPALLDKFLAFYDRKGKTSLETMLQRWYIALEKEYRSQTAE